jgi:DNA-binding GntR family transcriptional regulator
VTADVFGVADAEPVGDGQALRERVAVAIRRQLLDGTLRPGDRVSASGIARSLGVSHIPVREALTRLQAEGYLEARKDRGFAVPVLSLDVFEDIAHWRNLIEDEAHRLLVPVMRDDVVSRMSEYLAEMDDACAAADRPRFLSLNHAFHFLPFETLGSARLVAILRPLWELMAYYYTVIPGFGLDIDRSQQDHRELLDAYRERDVDAAVRVSARHRASGLEVVRAVLDGSEAAKEAAL